MQDKNQQLELDINNELVQNQGRNTARLYVKVLIVYFYSFFFFQIYFKNKFRHT